MLQSLELENFKAFGKRAHIPFAPITLIFGENSAGKSTVLQALNLLKQTRESRETGAMLLPRAKNGIVDLGSFQEMIFDHDLTRTLSIRVETTVSHGMFQLPYKGDKIAIELRFNRTSLDEGIQIDQIGVYGGKSSKCLAKFQPLSTTEDPEVLSDLIAFFNIPRSLPRSKPTFVKCVWLTDEPEHWESEFEWCRDNKEEIVHKLRENLAELEHSDEAHQEDNNRFQEALESLNDDIKFFKSNFDLKGYISNRHQEEMNAVLRMWGFLPLEIRIGRRYPQIETPLEGPRSLLRRRSDSEETFNCAELAAVAYHSLERVLESLFPISSFRRPPERSYIFSGTDPENVGYHGDLLPDLLFRRRDLVEDTNKWLKGLNIGYELEINSLGDRSRDFFEVRLIDIRRKKSVNVGLSDVGFGISQLLPFIVQSLVSEEQIISIEQPEVHVHPKLQADLGDLLVKAIERKNQFIVETHSEHLVLRLQRLVREKEIKPEDVSIIYVSRGFDGAEARRLRLDEDGYFIDEWPNGFFPERLRELR